MPRRLKRRTRRRITRRARKGLRRLKRIRKAKPNTSVIRNPTGFSDRLILKLDYFNYYQFSNGSGLSASIAFNGNSIYDPDHTTGIGAGSAFGFTEWKAIYGKYRVHGSSIRVQAAYSGSTTMPVWVGVLPHTSYSLPTTPSPFGDMPYASTKIIMPNSPATLIKKYMSTSRIFGIPRSTFLGDSRYEGTNAADPAIPWVWHVATRPLDITTATTTYIQVRIRYYVEMYDRFDLSS